MTMLRPLSYLLFALLFVYAFAPRSGLGAPLPQDDSAAVILVYFRIGEDSSPSTNIRAEQFLEHVEELTNGSYNVLPLPQIVDALKTGAKLPDRSVALTFDGGYASALKQGAPILIKNNIPFTIFVAPENLDHESDSYISAGALKKLARHKLVTIGLHPMNYAHLTTRNSEEIKRQVNAARASLRDLLGVEATLFAYPFGEYDDQYEKIIADSGFQAAFGQQSGVAYAGADMYSLPRFTMTENFGGPDRFGMTVNAQPFPVSDVEPADLRLTTARPDIGFTVDENLRKDLGRLSCFASGQEKPNVEVIGARVELRLERDLDEARTRINCTLPAEAGDIDEDSRWRWFGMMVSLPGGESEAITAIKNDPEQPIEE